MTVITTRLTVSPDGAISVATPLAAGEYKVSLEWHDRPARQLPCRSTSMPYPLWIWGSGPRD
jgi:hypothetical protein